MKTERKTFVLDPRVLIHAPYSLLAFEEHTVVLTDGALQHLNDLSKVPGETGHGAREALHVLTATSKGASLIDGVKTPQGGTIRLEEGIYADSEYAGNFEQELLEVCKDLKKRGANLAALVSNDLCLQIKAQRLGFECQALRSGQTADADHQYTGRSEASVPGEIIDALYVNGHVDLKGIQFGQSEWTENEYLLLRDLSNDKHFGLARYAGGKLVKVAQHTPWGLSPRNLGQKFALDALMAPASEIPCVILKGGAGTGKTILSLAAALDNIIEKHLYDRCLITRPNIVMDKEIGFLKGSEEDKIGPLIRPVYDNLEQLTRNTGGKNKDGIMLPGSYAQKLFDERLFVAQALGYMRGRSVPNQILLIDECQNMTPTQAFSIITRAGENCKVILCGDVEQIDNPALDDRTNGLAFAAERMKGSPLVAQVTFTHDECVRSPLAAAALRMMSPKGIDFTRKGGWTSDE